MEHFFLSFDEILEATGGEWLNCCGGAGGVSSVITDSRVDCNGALFLALSGENFEGHDFLETAGNNGAAAFCVSREFVDAGGLPGNIPALIVDDTLKAYQDIASFHRRRLKGLKVVAITGSSGKTSTKEIVRSILSEHYGSEYVYATEANTNNHIGVPQNILNITELHKVCVLEMGSNHHGEIEPLSRMAEPDVAIVTSIGQCHLESFGDLDGVALEKSTIFMCLKDDGVAVIPYECHQRNILESVAKPSKALFFGNSKEADVGVRYLVGNLKGSDFELTQKSSGDKIKISWSLSGRHQALNAAAAACAAVALGIGPDDITKGLENASIPGMRMKVTERNGVTWINDAYNANPESMASALSWLSEFADYSKLVLALGDMLELGEASEEGHLNTLRFASQQFTDSKIVIVGERMIKACNDNDFRAGHNILMFETAEKAVDTVRKMARRGMTVFLKASRGIGLERIEPQ